MPSALLLAGITPTAEYNDVVRVLRGCVLTTAPYEPPTSADSSSIQQHKRQLLSKADLGWHGGDKLAFLESAKLMSHPAQKYHTELPADLIRTIQFIVGKREQIVQWRKERTDMLLSAASSLLSVNRQLTASMEPNVAHVASEYNVAFMCALIDATDHPDKYLGRNFVKGFPVYGTLAKSGAFADGGEAPEMDSNSVISPAANQLWNAQLFKSVQQRGLAASGDSADAIDAVWIASVKECDEGWTLGVRREGISDAAPLIEKWRGFTASELDHHPWFRGRGSWRAMRRFGVYQNGKWRPIDDGTESLINPITGTSEKLTLITADMPARIAQCYAHETELWQQRTSPGMVCLPDALEQGTDDVKKAFRRIPNAAPGIMICCVFNPVMGETQYFIIPSFVFGVVSAVMAFNRLSYFYCHVARRLAAIPTVAYFDDFATQAPSYDRGSSQECLGRILDAIGPGFAAEKHVPMDQISTCIGVQTDFSRIPAICAIDVSVTDSRRKKVVALVDSVLDTRHISKTISKGLFGKARFTVCPIFGRSGIALLQPLQLGLTARYLQPGSELERCLVALRDLISDLKPVRIPLFPRMYDQPVVVLTDASFSSMSGKLGVFIWDPLTLKTWYTALKVPAAFISLLQSLELKKTYICQLELVAALAAYLTFPDIVRGRLVNHFIDNDPAKSNLISGYSPHLDSARIVHQFHLEALRLDCHPWLSFVYSEDNLADDPSRFEFSLLRQLKSEYRACKLPDLTGWGA